MQNAEKAGADLMKKKNIDDQLSAFGFGAVNEADREKVRGEGSHKKQKERKREAELLFDDPRLPRIRNKIAQLVRNNVTVFFTVDDTCSVEEEEKKKDYFWTRKNMAKVSHHEERSDNLGMGGLRS